MAEEKAPSALRGWIKAGITSVMGLLSGAVLMYVSPLVTNVIKPGKPLANFGQQVQGLTVTFQNRSTGATEGWWDYGDGTPLEPFSPTQDTVTHLFPHPGSYSVKLSLRNFLGDENDRSVTVNLDGNTSTLSVAPVIEAFNVETIKADAPATFRVASQIKNADWCIWTVSDDRPIEVSKDVSANQEHYFTIKEPGVHTLKFAAVNGNQTVEQTKTVWVDVGNASAPQATLQVTCQVVPMQRMPKEVNFPISFPSDRKEPAFPFSLTHSEVDFQIADAKFLQPPQSPAKDVHLSISPDKSKVILTGELVKPGGIMAWQKNPPPVKWTPTVVLSLERRLPPVVKTFDPIMATLKLPGTTIIPLPKVSKHWEVKGTSLNLEVRDGATVVYKGFTFPASGIVRFKNQPYQFSATQSPDGIHLEFFSAQARLAPIGN